MGKGCGIRGKVRPVADDGIALDLKLAWGGRLRRDLSHGAETAAEDRDSPDAAAAKGTMR
jgi:hypothetical protein